MTQIPPFHCRRYSTAFFWMCVTVWVLGYQKAKNGDRGTIVFTATLRVRNVVDATRFLGAWLRAGEGIGWPAAGTMPNSLSNAARLSFSDLCILLFLFLSLCRLCVCVFLCSHWSLVDVPLIFFCPADHVPDWQPRVLLGMVEARSVNVKKTTTTTKVNGSHHGDNPLLRPTRDGTAEPVSRDQILRHARGQGILFSLFS